MNHLIQYKLTASKAALSGGQKDSNYQLVRVCNQLPKVEVEVLTNGSLVFEVPLLFIFWHRLLSVLLKGHFSRLSQKSFLSILHFLPRLFPQVSTSQQGLKSLNLRLHLKSNWLLGSQSLTPPSEESESESKRINIFRILIMLCY